MKKPLLRYRNIISKQNEGDTECEDRHSRNYLSRALSNSFNLPRLSWSPNLQNNGLNVGVFVPMETASNYGFVF